MYVEKTLTLISFGLMLEHDLETKSVPGVGLEPPERAVIGRRRG